MTEQAKLRYKTGYMLILFGAAVVGVALVLLSRDPLLALEVVRGIVDDRYLLTRGYEPIFSVGWIVIHLVIVVTGLLSIRAIRRAQSHAP